MKLPLVSCLLPTYNRAHYLAECLMSIINQKYKNLEIIVVDDGSTDSTPTLMKWFTEKYPNVKYYPCEHKGIAATRNYAISKSTGEYLAVFDSDDLFADRRISKQVALLEKNPDIDFTYSGYMEADENMVGFNIVEPPERFTAEDIRDNKTIPHGTTMARRKCFVEHPYDDRFTSNDDKKLFWDWFLAGYKCKPVKDILYIKRNHFGTVSIVQGKEVHGFNLELNKEINDYLNKNAK